MISPQLVKGAATVEMVRIPELADEGDVMREQLEYLITCAGGHLACGCSECQRYLRVKAILVEVFRPKVVAGTKLNELFEKKRLAAK